MLVLQLLSEALSAWMMSLEAQRSAYVSEISSNADQNQAVSQRS